MNRLFCATVISLLALAGLALLAWGVVGWWSFHRDSFVEEELALRALTQEVRGVRYRRTGDLEELGRSHWEWDSIDPATLPEIPWSVPFVRRVEYVSAENDDPRGNSLPPMSPGHVAARNRVLSLPGLRGYRDAQRSSDSDSRGDPGDLPLGCPLPELPEPELKPEALAEPLPTGTPLDDAERREVVLAMLRVWNGPVERPRLIHFAESWDQLTHREKRERATVAVFDGPMRLEYRDLDFYWPSLSRDEPNLTIATENQVHELCTKPGRRRIVSRIDRGLPDAERYVPRSALAPVAGDPPGYWSSKGGLLGPAGERIVRVDRIDGTRLRIESESAPSANESDEPWRFRAILRTDLGYAIERADFARYEPSGIDAPRTTLDREVRRLEKIEGETVAVERISDRYSKDVEAEAGRLFLDGSAPPGGVIRERVAIDFDPAYSPAALDPATYGVPPWREPTELPSLRGYRSAWAAGGVCLALATIGALLPIRPRRRRTQSLERPSRPAPIRLRFGLVSLIALTLLVIGSAGWVKRRIDETNDELSLLKDLLNEDSRVTFARNEAALPWTFVSTDSFPIGTPLATVQTEVLLPAELVDRLMARSPAVRFEVSSSVLYYSDRAPEACEPSVGLRFPEFEPVATRPPEDFEPIERGEPLHSEERDRIVAEAIAAWQHARGERSERFLLRRWSSLRFVPMQLTFRDGKRFWMLRAPVAGAGIWTADERFRRLFVEFDGGWRLASRVPIDEQPIDSGDRFETLTDSVESSYESGEDPIHLPAAPFAIPDDVPEFDERLDEALLHAAPGAIGEAHGLAVRVERLPNERYRFEIERSLKDDPPPNTPRVRRWVLLLRSDLDWCAEACDATESYFDPFSGDPFGGGPGSDPFAATANGPTIDRTDSQPAVETPESLSPPLSPLVRQREVRSRNTLKRIGGEVFAVDAQYRGRDGATGEDPPWNSERSRLAIDLAPDIDERLFSRPTLDSSPPSLPRESGFVAWYGVAFAIGAVTLAGQGLRRGLSSIVSRIRHRRLERASPNENAATGKDVA